jgi:predicted nucleotidyltransferase
MLNKFEEMVQNNPDLTIFEIKKFIKLASDCNPNVIEILHTEPSDHLLITPLGQKLLDNRNMFLSKRVRYTFMGYAASQMRRINSHYKFLKNPLKTSPTRKEFGLDEVCIVPKEQKDAAFAAIQKKLDEWSWREMEHIEPALRQSIKDEFYRKLTEITSWAWQDIEENAFKSAAKTLGMDTNFIGLLNKERAYTAKLREWQQYQEWKKNRNPARAELEAKYGFDCKHACQLYRLSVMCREILTTGKVIVKRPDAEQILAIRNGAWTYEQLIEWFEKQDNELGEIYLTSNVLPHSPDLNKINELCMELVEESFK